MKTQQTFDLALYAFKRNIHGPMCHSDETKLKDGQILAVLHPIQTADPDNLYAFGLDKTNGQVYTVLRKNLRFKNVQMVKYEPTPLASYAQVVHEKLEAALKYLVEQDAKQLQIQ